MVMIPTQITFRGLAHSDALEGEIRERSAWLGQFYADILGCRVLVEVPHRHRHSGRHFHVRIEVTVPGATVLVTKGLKNTRLPRLFEADVSEAARR